jgi:alkylhydroperoxidase/carboxymuconolactone decarboxylase family protein YurZ
MSENPLSTLESLDPRIVSHLRDSDALVYESGALPKRIKLLIAMAFDAAHGAENGVRALAARAMQEGATKQEIAEVLRVAWQLTGAGTLYTASAGLKGLL